MLRWGADIRAWDELALPPEGAKAAGLTERELAMAKQLVDDMTDKWDPARFTDSFKDEIMALVKRKVAEGKTETVIHPDAAGEAAPGQSGAQILDLTELLQRSLRKNDAAASTPATEKPSRKAATVKAKVPAKTPAKTSAKNTEKKTPVRRAA